MEQSGPAETAERLGALSRRFFDAWTEAEPEEATTLGLKDAARRLRDPSQAAAEAHARTARAALVELDAIEREGTLDHDARLDAWAIRAHANERVLAADRRHAETGLDAVTYEMMMLAHAAARVTSPEDRETVSERLAALPAFIASARAALEAGVRDGRAYSSAVLDTLVAQFESGEADLAEIAETAHAGANDPDRALALERARDAGRAVLSFRAFLAENVASSPGVRELVPMGEVEYQRRLNAWWSLGSIDRIRRLAQEELERSRAKMIELAAPLTGAKVDTFADAKRVLDAVMAPKPSSASEVIAVYERAIARAVEFCRARANFTIPERCHCEVRRSPELWRRMSVCTNWPAPLLGGDAPGACAVVVDPALHPLANVPGLAVHEAVPGHFLQSRAWQLRFGGARAPVRFLSVPDECGIVRDAWIPHFMIEGWAVFAEVRMEEAGFYDGVARLFHVFCRAIHAARALADMGVHTEEWSRERVTAFLAEATGMPARMCRDQSVRYARSGMQALTYLIGQIAIEDARDSAKARLGAGYDELAFQSALLDAGPVPPALVAGDP
jgi:uncharacterized protein (DUF885 family)